MHSSIILTALFAGSQITAAAVGRDERGLPAMVAEDNNVQEIPSGTHDERGVQWEFPGPDSWNPFPWGGYGPPVGYPPTHHTTNKPKPKPKTTKHQKPTHHLSAHKSGHSTVKHPSQHPQPKPTPKQYPNKPKPHSSQKPHSSHKPQSSYGGGTGPGAQPADYMDLAIHHHNIHRHNHSAPPIAWDHGLALTAAKIAASCFYKHNTDMDGGGYGQNIAAGIEPKGIAHIISDGFYNSEVNDFRGQYGKPHPTGFESWGHFSQLIWKKTTHVGCHTQYCPHGLKGTAGHAKPYFTVCNYQSPGNVFGKFNDNVGRPLGLPTVRGGTKDQN